MVNFTTHIFISSGAGTIAYPDDYTGIVYEKMTRFTEKSTIISAFRDGDMVYYAIKAKLGSPLNSKAGKGISHVGILLTFSGVRCTEGPEIVSYLWNCARVIFYKITESENLDRVLTEEIQSLFKCLPKTDNLEIEQLPHENMSAEPAEQESRVYETFINNDIVNKLDRSNLIWVYSMNTLFMAPDIGNEKHGWKNGRAELSNKNSSGGDMSYILICIMVTLIIILLLLFLYLAYRDMKAVYVSHIIGT